MKKVQIEKFIDKVYDSGKLINNLSIVDFKEIERLFNELKVNKQSETILKNPAMFFEKYGCKIIKKAISYKIIAY